MMALLQRVEELPALKINLTRARLSALLAACSSPFLTGSGLVLRYWMGQALERLAHLPFRQMVPIHRAVYDISQRIAQPPSLSVILLI